MSKFLIPVAIIIAAVILFFGLLLMPMMCMPHVVQG